MNKDYEEFLKTAIGIIAQIGNYTQDFESKFTEWVSYCIKNVHHHDDWMEAKEFFDKNVLYLVEENMGEMFDIICDAKGIKNDEDLK